MQEAHGEEGVVSLHLELSVRDVNRPAVLKLDLAEAELLQAAVLADERLGVEGIEPVEASEIR